VASHGFTYQDLVQKTISVFPNLSSIGFSWVDDENDTVVINSDEELTEALRIMVTEGKGYLRFKVVTVPSQLSTSVSPAATFGTITHIGVTCDICGVSPIKGSRFKCTGGSENHDLCETCEGNNSNDCHPTLKIYHPGQFLSNMAVLLQEKGRQESGLQCHRGVVCDGCSRRDFKGLRFKCTERNDFNLCEACEGQDSHLHAMVKMYPHHSHMVVHIVPDAHLHHFPEVSLPPDATCHFRHSLYKHHGPSNNHKGNKGNTRIKNGKGRHCWDRSSVAKAAALKAKTKIDEASKLEDQLLEMAIIESLSEATTQIDSGIGDIVKNTSAGREKKKGRHCWDRSSVEQAAADRARMRPPLKICQWDHVATSVDNKQPTRQCSFLRKGCGRHNWDHIPTDKQLKFVIEELANFQDQKEIAHLKSSRLAMYQDEASREKLKASECTHEEEEDAVSQCMGSQESPFKRAVKWEIANSSRCKKTSKCGTPIVLPTAPPSSPKGSQRLVDNKANEVCNEPKPLQQFDAEVAAWGHELEVLCDMGFTNLQQILPLLRTHISTPTSTQHPGAVLSEKGMQAVALALLDV
jgi:hypothetical protein